MYTYSQLSSQHQLRGAVAMLLAAGRGQRMMPLTANNAKPLLNLRGKPIIQWQLEAMKQQGIEQVLINTAWQNDKMQLYCKTIQQQCSQQVPTIIISDETATGAPNGLETAGGIVKALPDLADVFWLTAADVYAPDFNFSVDEYAKFLTNNALAKIWLIANPQHNPNGDFFLDKNGIVFNHANLEHEATQSYTYSCFALLRKQLFMHPWCSIALGNPTNQRLALAVLLRQAADAGLVHGSIYHGNWTDVGTVQRLEQLNQK